MLKFDYLCRTGLGYLSQVDLSSLLLALMIPIFRQELLYDLFAMAS